MKQVFRVYSSSALKVFLKSLRSMNVYLAKVLAILWECSPFNIINEVIQKFESSRSVFQLLCIGRRRRQLYRILEVAKTRESKTISWLRSMANRLSISLKDFNGWTFDQFTLMQSNGHPGLPYCPTQYTQALRDHAWGKPVLTVTYPCTCDFFSVYADEENIPVDVREDHIWSILYLVDHQTNQHFTQGNKTPWVGTVTSEKLILPQVTLDFEGSISSKVSKLLKLVEYTRANGESILEVIKWMIEKVSGKTLDQFYTLIPRRAGGTIAHRLRSRAFNETVMINELPNRSQLISIHHDTHVSLQARPGDFSVNYMALLIHHLTTILFPLECTSYIDERKYGKNFYSQVRTTCASCFFDVTDLHQVTIDHDLPDIAPLPGTNPLIGFTETLTSEISRRIQALGLRPRFQTFQREIETDDVTPEIANHLVASALIQEHFGGSQEAYELGITLNYETHMMRMDALYNAPPKSNLSIRDWKAVSGESLMYALIRECHNWVIRNPLLRTRNRDDLINLPPQLNPFTIIAQKLILARKVQELEEAFVTAGYRTRPLGALDLNNNTCLSKWLMATVYPIVEAIFRDHALAERVCTFYTYESDEAILGKVNRIMSISCLNYFQNILRILYIVYILGYPIEDAIPYTFTATRLREEIRVRVQARNLTIEEIDHRVHACFKYLECFVNYIGVNFEVVEIGFGEQQFFVTGDISEEGINNFWEKNLEDLMAWPLDVVITEEVTEFEDLPEDIMNDLYELFTYPWVTTYRYGLYACVSLCRTLLDEAYIANEREQPTRSLPLRPIIIGQRENAIRDVRDLSLHPEGTGSALMANQIVAMIPEYEPVPPIAISMTHFSRINGHTITSVVKLHELFILLDIHEKIDQMRSPYWCMCLADGEGGFTNYLLGLSPHCRVIFNTLYQPHPDETVAISIPGEVLLSRDMLRINRCVAHHNYTSSNDLTQVGTIRILEELALRKSDQIGMSIITFDAEGSHLDDNETYFKLLVNVFSLVLRSLAMQGTAIIKTFLSKNHQFWSLLNSFTDLFSYFRFIKPTTSHTSNSEFYVVVANPVFHRPARIEIANRFENGTFYGPANFDLLQESRIVVEDILRRRNALRDGRDTPHCSLTWAAINWGDPRLPPLTWGIIFRRLHLIAPPELELIDPITKEFVWRPNTRRILLDLCHQTLRQARETISSGTSSILDHTTHTHICQRLAIYTRLLAFRSFLLAFPNNICNTHAAGISVIIDQVITDVIPLAAPHANHWDPHEAIVNPGMENLEVNLLSESREGVILAMRVRSAEHAYLYRSQHGQPPPAPIFPNYDPYLITNI